MRVKIAVCGLYVYIMKIRPNFDINCQSYDETTLIYLYIIIIRPISGSVVFYKAESERAKLIRSWNVNTTTTTTTNTVISAC